MGFTCGFYKFKKSFPTNYHILAQDELKLYKLVESYLHAKHYNWEEEAKEQLNKISELATTFDMTADDVINNICQYNPNINNFESYTDNTEIESWCSDGGFFHDALLCVLPGQDKQIRVITRENLPKLCEHIITKFENDFKLEAVALDRSFINKQDEDGEDCSIYKNIDGIEIIFDNGMKKDIYKTDGFDESELYAAENYFDSFDYYAMRRLITCLMKIACETDWYTELVYYEGGW